MVTKALSIAEVLYRGYLLVFLFDNATSHSVYAKDVLHTGDVNKSSGGKQPYLCNGRYRKNGVDKIYPMSI